MYCLIVVPQALWTLAGLIWIGFGIASGDSTRSLTGIVCLGVSALLPATVR